MQEQALAAVRRFSLPLLASIVCLPLLVVVGAFFVGLAGAEQRDTLHHLWQYVIGEYVLQHPPCSCRCRIISLPLLGVQ